MEEGDTEPIRRRGRPRKPADSAEIGDSTQPKLARRDTLPPIPPSVGIYRVESRLGTGAMGEVLLAQDATLPREIAIKRIRSDREATDEALRRFRIEAHVTARLQHPAIVPVYQYVEDGKDSFYTMRPVEGMSLADLVSRLAANRSGERKEWPTARLVRLFLQVCSAVAYAHSMGVLHRDLKPANIMIGPFEEVLVLDWGMAAVLSEMQAPPRGIARGSIPLPDGKTESRALIGTPAYMAPELFESEPASFATEVFALGIVLYELLALRRPWIADRLDELAPAMQQQPPAPSRLRRSGGIPARLDRVVLRAIDVSPQGRFDSVREFAQEVAEAVEGRAPWSAIPDSASRDNWWLSDGKIREEGDEMLLVSRGRPFRIAFRPSLSENVRVEFEVNLTRGTHDLEIFLNAATESDGMIHGGYGLCVLPGKRKTVSLLRSGRPVAGGRSPSFAPGQWYRIAVQREDDHLSLEIDGEPIYTYHDPIPLTAGTLIFQGRSSGLHLRNLRVLSRGANATVSCLAVPDALYNRGYYEEARVEYANIVASHHGRNEALLARFRYVLSSVELARREDDSEVRAMLLDEARSIVQSDDSAALSPLSSVALAVIGREQGDLTVARHALDSAFREFPDDPHLPTIREWVLGQLHSSTEDDRRLIADLLPIALSHCLDGWSRHGVHELIHRIRRSWETPSFLIGRAQFNRGIVASRAEAILFCAFWAGRPEIVESMADLLVRSRELRSYHVSDLVFSLLELHEADRARRVLERTAGYGESNERTLRFRVAADAATSAATGDVDRAEALLRQIDAGPFDREFNSARLWIARSWWSDGQPGRALDALQPIAANDLFAHEHRAWFFLEGNELERAHRELDPLLRRKDHVKGRNLANFLYGAVLIAKGRERDANRVFQRLRPHRWPRTWTLGSHYATGRLGDGSIDDYLGRCLPWERLTLEQHRKLLMTVRER